MSRPSTVSEKTAPERHLPARVPYKPIEPVDRFGKYHELIRQLFQVPSAVAIVGSSLEPRAPGVCDEIAAELAASGKLVVVVRIKSLLLMNPIAIPEETAFLPGTVPNVWVWPSPGGQHTEVSRSSQPGHWLDALRRHFDSIVLDCPSVQATPGVAEVAAMADAAVLLVEARRTLKQDVQRDQSALQLRGVRLAGSILIRGR